MHVAYGEGKEHAARLARGLARLGPDFLAKLCYWCDGTGTRKFEGCDVCMDKKLGYGSALGLLIGNTAAGQSVVNQVLVAGERGPCLFPSCQGQCGRTEPCDVVVEPPGRQMELV